jgi:hypothetical protein
VAEAENGQEGDEKVCWDEGWGAVAEKSKKSKKKKAKGGDEGGAAAAAAAEEEEEPQSQAASHRPVEVCAGCGCGGGGGSMKKCGTCRSVRYCGSECQHKHWAVHKVHCKGKGQAWCSRVGGGCWGRRTWSLELAASWQRLPPSK